MIDLGALRLLTSRSKAVVYIAICAHVNQEAWTARPTLKRIAHLTGLNKSTVIRAVSSLCESGLICKKTGGGRELANEYTIVTEKGDIATPPFIVERVASEEVKGRIFDDKESHNVERVASEEVKGRITTPPFTDERVTSESAKGDILPPKGCHSCATPTENTIEEKRIEYIPPAAARHPPQQTISPDFNIWEWAGVSETDHDRWERSFPGIDVQAELLSALAWCHDNGKKGEKKNYRMFLGNWLRRAQKDEAAGPPKEPTELELARLDDIEFAEKRRVRLD